MNTALLSPPPPELAADAPDAHWVIEAGATGAPRGRCSLWWDAVPAYPSQRLGLIGHYSAADAEAGRCLLTHASQQLAARGCTLAVGPMDGNTWRRYRFITERGSEPVFFLEPDNPDDWPHHFTAAGFSPLASYSSALNPKLGPDDARERRALKRFDSLGVRIRPLDMTRFDEDLRRIYQVSIVSFQQNFLYTPIREEEFMAMYQKVRLVLRPELILIAEQEGRAVGFSFSLPDLAQARRGEAVDTIIIKTLAVLPDAGCRGLGSLLLARSQVIACQLGYTRAIHALMHETNRSRNLSAHYAHSMRRYTLFARPLRP